MLDYFKSSSFNVYVLSNKFSSFIANIYSVNSMPYFSLTTSFKGSKKKSKDKNKFNISSILTQSILNDILMT